MAVLSWEIYASDSCRLAPQSTETELIVAHDQCIIRPHLYDAVTFSVVSLTIGIVIVPGRFHFYVGFDNVPLIIS